MNDNFGWGYSGFAHVFGFLVYGFVALLSVAVTVAVIFFLVRFLIYGTKAAQLYIAKNTPAKPAGPAAPLTEPATREQVDPNPERIPPTTTPTGSSTTTVAAPATSTPPAPAAAPAASSPASAPASASTPASAKPTTAKPAAEKPTTDKPVVPPAVAAPKAAPKATPPITPPATKKPPVKKSPEPPVA